MMLVTESLSWKIANRDLKKNKMSLFSMTEQFLQVMKFWIEEKFSCQNDISRHVWDVNDLF